MKQIILTLTFLIYAAFSFAQELKVKSFTHDTMNLEALLDGGRTDLNGRKCALVKVMVHDDIIECKGGNVGDIISKGMVNKIYVSPTAKYLEFEFKNFYPLRIKFSDYGFPTLSEGNTYIVKLVNENILAQQQSTPSSDIIPITVNGVTFNMIKVDGGTFMMGATEEQENPESDENSAHQVTLSTYYIGETEVTQALWNAVMGKNPSEFKGDNLPVEHISWDDCQIFINRLNSLTGRKFRLPTEAEWEFAARGGNYSRNTQFSGSDNLDEVAWYDDNSSDKTHPVKTKKPNELGIYDMSGNVCEWCQDQYGSNSSNTKPKRISSSNVTNHVYRGGCWCSLHSFCKLSSRFCFSFFNIYRIQGLRLVLSKL